MILIKLTFCNYIYFHILTYSFRSENRILTKCSLAQFIDLLTYKHKS